MKVLLVHNYYQQPGGEDVVFEQERKLLEGHGHRVVSYVRRNDEVRVHSGLAQISSLKKAVWATDVYDEILEVIWKERPQIAHVHNTLAQISPSVFGACRAGGVPTVQTLHNFRLLCPAATFFRNGKVCEDCLTSSLWQGVRHACYRDSFAATGAVAFMLGVHRWAGTWAKNVDAFIALTQFSKGKFVAGGLPAERIFVKPNFVPSDPGVKETLGDYAVFVGRLSPEKGLKTLLEAWRQLRTPIPLEIIGDGPLRDDLLATASRYDLRNVVFPGRLSAGAARSRVRAARFLVLPSECYENFPMAIAEAFSSGTPVVCSRLGAMQEIVIDGETGLHFAAGNAEDLARRVEWAWNNPHALESMGKAARREYELKYTAEANYAALMEIYERVIISGTLGMTPIPVRAARRDIALVGA